MRLTLKKFIDNNTVKIAAVILLSIIAALLLTFILRDKYAVKTYQISDFSLKDLTSNGSELVSNSEDPQMIKYNLNMSLNNITLHFNKPLSDLTNLTFYYTLQANQDFDENMAINFVVPNGKTEYSLRIPNIKVVNIRLDIGDVKGLKTDIDSIEFLHKTLIGQSDIDFQKTIIFFLLFAFLAMHFIININKLYGFIFRYRYLIAFSFLIVIVICGYNGSSIATWNHFVQPNNISTYGVPIFGVERPIRGDEWLVGTSFNLSQAFSNHPYGYYSDLLRALPTDVFTVYGTPVFDIASIAKPFYWGYLFLGQTMGLSFYWFGRLFALFLVSFEFCRILSKDKRLISVTGAFIITFASIVQWWYATNNLMEMLIYGQLALILIPIFLNSTKKSTRIFTILGLIICVLGYIFAFYPAWQVPLAYVFFSIFIWIMIENFNKRKKELFDLIIILVAFTVIGLIVYRVLSMSAESIRLLANTAYPGKRFETGGGVFSKMFVYITNPLFSYKQMDNPCEVSDVLNLFPIPLIVGIYVLIKNKMKDVFLICTIILSLILMAWLMFKWPDFLAKITLLSTSPAWRSSIAFDFLQVFILVRVFSNYKNIMSKPFAIITSILCGGLIIYEAHKLLPGYMPRWYMLLAFAVIVVAGYIVCTGYSKKSAIILCSFAIVASIFTGATVNPLMKGLDAIYQKPLAKEIQQIEKTKAGIWLGVDGAIWPGFQQFALVNGAKTINSVNTYPAFENWKSIDPQMKYHSVYNRYAHIYTLLTNEKTTFELLGQDTIKLKLSVDDIPKLKINYILSDIDPSKIVPLSDNSVKLKTIYSEDGMNIYEAIYK
jgi:hypothetical protein